MKATEQYFPVVLFIMLYKVVLIFESVNEVLILRFDYSNESYRSVLSYGAVYESTYHSRLEFSYNIGYWIVSYNVFIQMVNATNCMHNHT